MASVIVASPSFGIRSPNSEASTSSLARSESDPVSLSTSTELSATGAVSLLGERHAHQADHHEKARDETYKQHTDRRSQYVFEKVLHILTICLFRVTIRAGERDSMCRNHFCHETLPALAANPNPTIVQAGASPLQR